MGMKRKAVYAKSIDGKAHKTMGDKKDVKNTHVRNGYILFRMEFEKGKEFMTFAEKLTESTKAWRNLTEEERKEYNERAKQGRPEKLKRNYTVAFHSRCSLNQFTKLVDYVKGKPKLKAKIARIGFGDLLDVECMRLPRDILVAIMRAYDPPTNQFRIRGKTIEIEANDVAELLGVPHGGEEVKVDIGDTNETFKRLKTKYGKLKYENILNAITSGKADEDFEFLFMLYTLGTFLVPTASATISDKLLKLMCCTMKGFSHFDWATYIVNDLRREMTDYVQLIRSNKEGSCYVGGCLYMLLLYFGERFPLSKPVFHESTTAIQFWTKGRVKEMIERERQSDISILYTRKGRKVTDDNDIANKNRVPYLDPELKELHGRLLAIIDENHKRLVCAVEEELCKAQLKIERQRNQQAEDPIDMDNEDGQDDEGHEDIDADVDDANRDNADENDDSDIGGRSGPPNITIAECNEATPNQGGTCHNTEQSGDEDEQFPRRSKRPKMPKYMSPWTLTKPVKRKRKGKDDKENFFQLISRIYTKDEGEQTLLEIGDEDIQRHQLWTLGGLHRISNRVMSVVCKTLMADMKNTGQVTRHIFDADFMLLLSRKPIGWSVTEWRDQLFPHKVGYNIADCELIMGPMLVAEHWFCVAVEPKTMNFFVLDSMKPLSFMSKSKKLKKQSALLNPQESVLCQIRDRFDDIISLVRPQLTGKKARSEIIRAPVPQQNNLRDCGVHVLIWLKNWKPGVTMEYGEDEVQEYRKNLMWWLVNHELNQKRDTALGLLTSQMTQTRRK